MSPALGYWQEPKQNINWQKRNVSGFKAPIALGDA
jgi:hypothetical protein